MPLGEQPLTEDDKKYRAESDLDAFKRVEEVRVDPERMAMMAQLVQKEKVELQNIEPALAQMFPSLIMSSRNINKAHGDQSRSGEGGQGPGGM
ncbi:hypothetical protein LCGC14_0359660 [marine sediment metagenome]|uniref:Uncharacterized protein n=1 Tax=marine sediment metagenome TaxID=412755 RepID=A0A0F9VVS6_9ZZZZ|nr:hypothetical protein [Candidatus Aminicenantes bacterium]